mmetsp:Transcript_20569/g.48793  ORF Transcript_20569/g.48793 Transcript_20569/m.48793 type:complete len:251 (+) Transcript_20569:315-1067(+)
MERLYDCKVFTLFVRLGPNFQAIRLNAGHRASPNRHLLGGEWTRHSSSPHQPIWSISRDSRDLDVTPANSAIVPIASVVLGLLQQPNVGPLLISCHEALCLRLAQGMIPTMLVDLVSVAARGGGPQVQGAMAQATTRRPQRRRCARPERGGQVTPRACGHGMRQFSGGTLLLLELPAHGLAADAGVGRPSNRRCHDHVWGRLRPLHSSRQMQGPHWSAALSCWTQGCIGIHAHVDSRRLATHGFDRCARM